MEHSFNTAIAGKFGILSAVLVSNIKFWIDKNKANNVHFHEGRYWTYNSSSAFSQLFQYATESQIRYALKKLRDEGILMTGNFSDDAKSRTLWYAFTDKGEAMLKNPETFFSMEESQGDPQMDQTESPAKDVDDLEAMRQDSQMHLSNLSNASDNSSKCISQNSQMHLSNLSNASDKILKSFIVTDNKQQIVNTDINTDISADIRTGASSPKTHARFVPPTLDEVNAYCKERGNSVDPEAFIAHYESNGWMVGKTRMKDWRAAIRTWERNNVGKAGARRTMTMPDYGRQDNAGKVDPAKIEELRRMISQGQLA